MLDFSKLGCDVNSKNVVVALKVTDSKDALAVTYNDIMVLHIKRYTGAVVFMTLTADEQRQLSACGVSIRDEEILSF